jgi:hypothetical protein
LHPDDDAQCEEEGVGEESGDEAAQAGLRRGQYGEFEDIVTIVATVVIVVIVFCCWPLPHSPAAASHPSSSWAHNRFHLLPS